MAMSGYMCRPGIVRFKRIFPILRNPVRTSTYLVPETNAEDDIEYPPIKPRWPPGSWGGMIEKHAWQQWERKVELETQDLSVQQRMEKAWPEICWSWKFPAIQHYPDSLRYQQDVTKTCLLTGMPDYYETLEEEATTLLPTVKSKVEEGLLLENDLLDRSDIRYEAQSIGAIRNQCIRSQLIDCLLTSLSAEYPHLQTCQLGENVKVKAFWDRHGFPPDSRVFKIMDADEEEEFHSTNEERNFSRFHSELSCTQQLRSELPLKPFVDRSDPLCTETPYSNFKYWPKDLAQFRDKVKTTCLPGYFHGDPCEFGLVSFDCPSKLHRRVLKYGKEVTAEIQTGLGLTSSFAWTVAQAHFQGFNTYTELIYPLTSQMIITDGQQYSFYAYQLNTLELWKDDTANPLRNLCWHQENLKLYEDIQNGQFIGFNDDVLKLMIKFFINQPCERDYPLRPYLPPASEKDTPYINFS